MFPELKCYLFFLLVVSEYTKKKKYVDVRDPLAFVRSEESGYANKGAPFGIHA